MNRLITSKFSFSSSRKFFTTLNKNVSRHSKLIVIGAGTGGLSVAGQLKNQKILNQSEITIFDPAKEHYYQPGFTKIAGGVIESNYVIKNWVKYDMKDLTANYNFKNEAVASIDPENNSIKTESGDSWTYDNLVIASGLRLKKDSIPGLKELMEDPNKMVGTIYDFELSKKVSKMRKDFKGGRALFTQAPAPLKCAGAPQKIAYLCQEYWKKNGISADIHFFTPLPQMFGVNYYSNSLTEIVKEKGITPHYNTELVSVSDGVAKFKNVSDNTMFEEKFDFLHAVPLLSAPQYLIGSPVSNQAGFVDVDRTMRHKKYQNIWAIGDCVALPNAKTAAAAYSEAPVLVHNLKAQLETGLKSNALYDGYSACPLYIKKGQLLLAEFKDYNDENGKLVRELDESIHPGQQNKPGRFYYWMTYACTYFYRLGIKGFWFGKNSLFRPKFNDKQVDIRKYYKYLVNLFYLPVFALVYLIISSLLF